ncbi:MAG TPA: glycosyltransferase family 2 protein [Candidatus Acidoferrales bacterium]|nr:glycosyltransferase family 2 protein [Candidatus Acidoferrales bacterium]
MNDVPAVSCLTVTWQRLGMLTRAVECFRRQTLAEREMVIVYGADDRDTARYVESLEDPSIRGVRVAKRYRLGWLRNIAVENARGECVAVWDDDDWSAPNRLHAQLRAIDRSGKAACVLSKVILHNSVTQRSYLSHERTWEASLVARRKDLPSYDGSLSRFEDTPVVMALEERGELALLKRPDLYVYVYHGTNTWQEDHFEKIIKQCVPLSDKKSTWTVTQLHGELT